MMKEELIAKYEPLVKATAKRYAGRGAEYEDLVQEGYLALLILNEKCTDKEWLTAFIARRLPGYVRRGACMAGRYDYLRRKLRPGEFILARDAMDGWTQNDLASKYDISQQAVSARMKKIRAKLEPVFLDRE